MQLPFNFNLDIEPTNRCNAKCYFCPRDATPHQGLMSDQVFDRTLARAVEFRVLARERFGTDMKVNLCGLGEPLLNRRTPDFVRRISEAGFESSISTNGSLLDEARSNALLDAGLRNAEINVGDLDDDYEDVYGLPFAKTCDNVVRFAELAGDRCEVRIVLVNHRRDPARTRAMKDFWRARGITQFTPFDVMNRGGTLFVDEMQYSSFPERSEAIAAFAARGVHPMCGVPFLLLFVGYDGQYYLCCSDWKKEVPLGSVFDESFVSVVASKLERVSSREPICKSCNHDPVNRLTDALRAHGSPGAESGADRLLGELVDANRTVLEVIEELGIGSSGPRDVMGRPRRIPLRVE